MKAKILSFLICAACPCLFAVSSVDVVTTSRGGEVSARKVELKEVEKGVFRLEIPIRKIPLDAKYIDIKCAEAAAKKGDDGYWVLGDGRMGFFTRDSGSVIERRNPLPLYGVKKGDKAFVGIVKGLKYEFSSVIEVKGGKYEIFPRFMIEEMFFSPYEDLIIDFYSLEGENANYSGMGRAYRKYQLGRGEVIPLRERVKGNPQLAYTADTIFVRFSHSIKSGPKVEHQNKQNEPKVRAFRTFEQTKKNIQKLKELGVDKAEICLVGWNSGGFDGRFPTLFPAEEACGGEEKMAEVVDTAHELGYQIVVHVCNTDFYEISDRFDWADIAKRSDGTPHHHGILAGGRAYFPCFQQVYNKYVEDDFKRLRRRGFKGTHHIDVTSCITPYPCFDPMHPCNRQQTADYMNAIGALADKYFGGWGSEGPCDHVAKTLDYALYIWAYPGWVGRDTPLMDRLVPIWQIAYHGIILSNPYYATMDYNYDKITVAHAKARIAKAKAGGKTLTFNWPSIILEGKPLRRLKLYEFGGRPTFYGYIRDNDLTPIKAAYDEYQPMKYLQYEFMDFHGELAKDVFITKYSDGSEVVSNYTDKDYIYKGQPVKPMDYRLFKPDPAAQKAKQAAEAPAKQQKPAAAKAQPAAGGEQKPAGVWQKLKDWWNKKR